MTNSPLIYFTDAVLRAPTLGCMFMCLAAALIGVIIFLRKQSLVGESLSHAAYPGVIVGLIIAGFFNLEAGDEILISIFIMAGAFVSSMVGLRCITSLERYFRVRSDSALCFVLAAFFGIGVTFASQIQLSHPSLYRQAQVYLYGQAATMTDIHIYIYGVLSTVVLAVIIFFYKEIKIITFDRLYAKSLDIATKQVDSIIFILVVLSVVIGIRSVGVVLMSAMLIAPAVAARQYTHRLSRMFALAALFGLLSAFLGNYLSVELTLLFSSDFTTSRFTLPTGPMIVVVASIFCLASLLFAPEKGLLIRLVRIARFRHRCLCENVLKTLWYTHTEKETPFAHIAKYQTTSPWHLKLVLRQLCRAGWIDCSKQGYRLTTFGEQKASLIVRLHRLWEVYLVDYLGVGAERVHHSAEEMEHILTPELEKELTLLLNNPKYDPHSQPIPPKEF